MSPTLVVKGMCGRNVPLTSYNSYVNQQKREFHTSFSRKRFREILDNKLFFVTDVNNVALKYGLFGVAVGNPSTWVVSLISWLNSMGLPWWGAIGASRAVVFFLS